jgi:micrococcal nuclease
VRRIVAFMFAALLGACTGASGRPADPAGRAEVIEIVDGDTFVARIGGRDETIRMLGIDTPETKHPTDPVECFGPEATARLEALLPVGTGVRLERDREARDRYGRLLAYVYREPDGLFVNLTMVDGGLAATLSIPPNTAMSDRLASAAARARAAGNGLWGACEGR